MQVNTDGTNAFVIQGSDKEVDIVTKNAIKKEYSIEDELCILRKTLYAIINKQDIPPEFIIYNNFVNGIVDKNKLLKARR